MDKDVEAKMEKLVTRYAQAEAQISGSRPSKLPTGRSRRKLEQRVVDTLGELSERRKPEGGSLVRLAYVRGLRGVVPGARLAEVNEIEISSLESQLDIALGLRESGALMNFRNLLRRMKTAENLRMMEANPHVVEIITLPAKPYPLEQYARANVRQALEMASAAGALAGVIPGNYDGGPDAR